MNESFYDYEKVQALREKKGLSKQQMATALGVTLMTVYRIEEGTCSIELLAKVAIVLEVKLASLLRSAQDIVKNFPCALNIEC